MLQVESVTNTETDILKWVLYKYRSEKQHFVFYLKCKKWLETHQKLQTCPWVEIWVFWTIFTFLHMDMNKMTSWRFSHPFLSCEASSGAEPQIKSCRRYSIMSTPAATVLFLKEKKKPLALIMSHKAKTKKTTSLVTWKFAMVTHQTGAPMMILMMNIFYF